MFHSNFIQVWLFEWNFSPIDREMKNIKKIKQKKKTKKKQHLKTLCANIQIMPAKG